ncbi:mechanosensitive ion channel family protein, partial [Candidatus Woesearchaeota archaeon]
VPLMIELFTDMAALEKLAIDVSWKVLASAIVFIIGKIFIKYMDKVLTRIFDKTEWDEALEKFLQSLANGVAWIVVLLVILSIWNVDIGPMIASLGIAGFVLGFALKDTLGNLAAGAMMLIYKPFTVGHFVEVNGIKGTVRAIGISACTIDTPDNKRVIIPNAGVWGNPIINYSANSTRRIDVNVGISYSDDIGKAVEVAQKLLKEDKLVLDDPEPLVAVDSLGDSSVNLTLRFWVKREDYLSQKFAITRAIKEAFDKAGISIPFPQRDIHIISPEPVQTKPQKRKKETVPSQEEKLSQKTYDDE